MGHLGNYHLLLAHDVYANPHAYASIFRRDVEDLYIIMDNSLIELGYPAPMEQMREACKTVRADIVVLPDYLGELEMTLEASEKYAKQYNLNDIGPLMGVPQGKNYTEIMGCATELAGIENVQALGIPRHITEVGINGAHSRWGIVEALSNEHPDMDLHLLGFSDYTEDDFKCARHPSVMGIDSAAPVRLGLMGERADNGFDTLNNMPPRGGYWGWNGIRMPDEVIHNLIWTRNQIKDGQITQISDDGE